MVCALLRTAIGPCPSWKQTDCRTANALNSIPFVRFLRRERASGTATYATACGILGVMRRSARTWVVVVILGCVLAGGAYALTRPGKGQPGRSGGGASAAPGPRATPVVTAVARAGDLPVSLSALGSVTALNTVTVRSRVDGQLLKVHFGEGQLVRQGELLAEIDPSPFQAQLKQAEGQLARDMAALQNAQLDLERYRVLVDKEMIARQQYDTQAATVRQAEGTVKLKAAFANRDGALFPNQFVNARVLLDVLPNVVLAPSEAIQRGPQGAFVYVVKPDGVAQMRRLELGPSDGGLVAVKQGLAPGEAVVVDGAEKLQDGAKVEPRERAPARTRS